MSVAIWPFHILNSACGTIFANRSKAKLEALLWEDALLDAQKVATGIDACALIAFQPGIRDAREKLQWASARVTTLREDPAYSLFVIFGVRLPILYGENKQHALGRLLQEIVAQSGDVTALDWVGPPSEFNSCLPADISSYAAPPRTLPYLSEDEIRTAVSSLRHTVAVDQISKLYDQLDNMGAPHFANCRLRLSCIIFPVTEVRRSLCSATETFLTYGVKADGLRDLEITTEEKLIQFSRLRLTRRTFLLVRPWDRRLLGELADSDSHSRALRVVAHLGQPFGALLLAQQRGGEYKRIASDRDIVVQVKDMTSVANMMDIRTLEIM